MTHYYVYYRIDSKQLEGVRRSVEKIFAEVRAKTRVQGRWMRRRDDPSTYMEVYEGVSDPARFESVLERSGKGFAVPRRLEVFKMADLTD